MRSIFRIFEVEQFKGYILNTNFSRAVTVIQNHHTWRPGYEYLTDARDEMYWLNSMRASHVRDRKWSDIGQNITTFGNGKVALCRPIDKIPAGIYGANTGAICIEHFGNFDTGGDIMTEEHKHAIIEVNAILCFKFGLQPSTASVVYHHWYDTSGKRFPQISIDSESVQQKKLQKSCPGTNFFAEASDGFNGNTVKSAVKNFYPKIQTALDNIKISNMNVSHVQKRVNVPMLNVRSGPGTSYDVMKVLAEGTVVNIFESIPSWCRISNTGEEWVNSRYIM